MEIHMLEAIDWSVVIVGRWNPSILTPAGIAKRLFELKEDTPLEVQLAIDVMLPPVVTHDRLRVTAGSQRLIIEPLTHSYSCLDRARELARNALESLPETPIAACGVNVKYVYKEADHYLTRVQDITTCELDEAISSLNRKISKRSVSRSISALDGQLNLSVNEDDEEGHVNCQFNFEFISREIEEQKKWLKSPIDGFEGEVRTVFTKILGFSEELIPND